MTLVANINKYKRLSNKHLKRAPFGLTRTILNTIISHKKESQFMKNFRIKAYEIFKKKPLPKWGCDLSKIDFNSLVYYVSSLDKPLDSWQQLPSEIKNTYDKIGIPQAERNFLAGVSAQYDSEVVYKNLKKILSKKGVIFCDMDSAVRLYPRLVKKYFAQLVTPYDNKFAALNSAVWSGGSFLYIPKNISVDLPLQAYFRINAKSLGQFERTLIIADDYSKAHYIEGCTAPIYSQDSLHAAVVEIFVGKNASMRYTTVQNWSKNIYNLVTKRAKVEQGGNMEWVDCNIGSKATMKYPSIYLMGKDSHGKTLSISYAKNNQHQDVGSKIIHFAPQTTSHIVSKSISLSGGRTSYRGMIVIHKKAKNAKSHVICDALLMDEQSKSETHPKMIVHNKSAQMEHEASIEKISEEKLFYLTSRGISKQSALSMLITSFIEPVMQEIPLEYTIELYRLIQLEMESSIG